MLLGDFVKQMTEKIGAKPCIPCQARQEKMNQMHRNLNQKVQSILKNFGRGTSGSS